MTNNYLIDEAIMITNEEALEHTSNKRTAEGDVENQPAMKKSKMSKAEKKEMKLRLTQEIKILDEKFETLKLELMTYDKETDKKTNVVYHIIENRSYAGDQAAKIDDYEKSIACYETAVNYIDTNNLSSDIYQRQKADMCYNLGRFYREQKQPEKAIKWFNTSKKIYEELRTEILRKTKNSRDKDYIKYSNYIGQINRHLKNLGKPASAEIDEDDSPTEPDEKIDETNKSIENESDESAKISITSRRKRKPKEANSENALGIPFEIQESDQPFNKNTTAPISTSISTPIASETNISTPQSIRQLNEKSEIDIEQMRQFVAYARQRGTELFSSNPKIANQPSQMFNSSVLPASDDEIFDAEIITEASHQIPQYMPTAGISINSAPQPTHHFEFGSDSFISSMEQPKFKKLSPQEIATLSTEQMIEYQKNLFKEIESIQSRIGSLKNKLNNLENELQNPLTSLENLSNLTLTKLEKIEKELMTKINSTTKNYEAKKDTSISSINEIIPKINNLYKEICENKVISIKDYSSFSLQQLKNEHTILLKEHNRLLELKSKRDEMLKNIIELQGDEEEQIFSNSLGSRK